jgi:hypothetical protein
VDAGGGNHGGTSSCKMVAAQPEGLECSMFTMETTRRPSRLRDTRKRLGRFECHKIERWAQTSGAFISASYNAPLYPRETHQQVSRMASPHRRHYQPTGQAWLSSVRRIQAKTCCSLFRPLITVSSLPVSIISAETTRVNLAVWWPTPPKKAMKRVISVRVGLRAPRALSTTDGRRFTGKSPRVWPTVVHLIMLESRKSSLYLHFLSKTNSHN